MQIPTVFVIAPTKNSAEIILIYLCTDKCDKYKSIEIIILTNFSDANKFDNARNLTLIFSINPGECLANYGIEKGLGKHWSYFDSVLDQILIWVLANAEY